jgi:hypothetical protein
MEVDLRIAYVLYTGGPTPPQVFVQSAMTLAKPAQLDLSLDVLLAKHTHLFLVEIHPPASATLAILPAMTLQIVNFVT